MFSSIHFQPLTGEIRADRPLSWATLRANQPNIIFPQAFQACLHLWGTAFEIGQDLGHDPPIALLAALLVPVDLDLQNRES